MAPLAPRCCNWRTTSTVACAGTEPVGAWPGSSRVVPVVGDRGALVVCVRAPRIDGVGPSGGPTPGGPTGAVGAAPAVDGTGVDEGS